MLAEGIFRLKETESEWRHYIELPNGAHDDIYCGSSLEVCMGRWEETKGGEKLVPDHWLNGRYESDLRSDDPKAHLYLGYLYPRGGELVI